VTRSTEGKEEKKKAEEGDPEYLLLLAAIVVAQVNFAIPLLKAIVADKNKNAEY